MSKQSRQSEPHPASNLSLNPDVVPSIPASWYHDPEIFEREKNLIFDREWIPLGPVAMLPNIGDWLVAKLTGASVLVTKTATGGGDIKAFHNVCRHRGAPIVDQPRGNSRRFVCPYHGWVYELDGTLKSAPGFEVAVAGTKEDRRAGGDACDSYNTGLLPVRSEIWNGVVWACLSESTRDLHDWLGDIPAIATQFTSVDSFEYETVLRDCVDINWKAYADNSAEGYHLEYIHPELAASITANSNIRSYTNGQFVGFDIEYMANEKQENCSKGFWIYKFPGVLLHFSDHSFNLERVTPISASQILLSRWFWFDKSIDRKTRAKTIASSNQVMAEDIDICKKVQQSLRNGRIERGVLSKSREPGTVYMQQLVEQRLNERELNTLDSSDRDS